MFVATAIIIVVVIFEKNKSYKFDLKDKIINYKIFNKRAKKKKNQEIKRRMIRLKFLLLLKKTHKIDLNNKIESIKTLTKDKMNKIRNQK